MKDDRAIYHASAALGRLLDPIHPNGLDEAKRQLKRLTAEELRELMVQLLVLGRLAQEIEQIEPTDIVEGLDHRMPYLAYYDGERSARLHR